MPEPSKRYHVVTFGCQMNEHDSERLSGMLEADGMTRTDDVDDADVVVLNTCCIRENADNKLYGALGHLKALKERRPEVQIAVGGCLAQKDRDLVRERASHVDVVFGTHNVHRAVGLLDHAAHHGPVVEILEATARDDNDAFPSSLPARREKMLPMASTQTVMSIASSHETNRSRARLSSSVRVRRCTPPPGVAPILAISSRDSLKRAPFTRRSFSSMVVSCWR